MISLLIGIAAFAVVLAVSKKIGIIVAIGGIVAGIIGIRKKDQLAIIGIVVCVTSILLAVLTMNIASKKDVETDTIKYSRMDSFSTTAKHYMDTVRMEAIAGNLKCSPNASEDATNFQVIDSINGGNFVLFFATSKDAITSNIKNFDNKIAEQAVHNVNEMNLSYSLSPWNKEDLYGWVHWRKDENNRDRYFVAITDAVGHGISKELPDVELKRSNIKTENAKADLNGILSYINSDSTVYYCRTLD